MKLIPLSEFVLQKTTNEWSATRRLSLIIGYAEFLRQPLTLGMFVPADDKGNVIDRPSYKLEDYSEEEIGLGYMECDIEIYEKAAGKVLFADAVTIDKSPYQSTQRLIIDLAVDPVFRIYTELRFWDGAIDKQEFPNNKNLTIEDLVKYGLPLTPSALKLIGEKE